MIRNFSRISNLFTKSINLQIKSRKYKYSVLFYCTARMSQEGIIAEQAKKLATPLSTSKHKGQAGRIGVVGGSVEFTGAPYFASIASLRTGADLSYVFTIKDAAPVIKSYSPELMVLPYLDDPQAIEKIEPWLERLHVVLLGPGLGRLESTKQTFEKLISILRTKQKPIIIDADGLFFVSLNPKVLENYPATVILTPNKMEFKRLAGTYQEPEQNKTKLEEIKGFLDLIGPKGTIFCKDEFDEILHEGKSIQLLSGGGSARRCGGQGDLLGGAMATFLAWALEKNMEPSVACYAASKLTRECNYRAFQKVGRGMLVTDMIHEIPAVFNDKFEAGNLN